MLWGMYDPRSDDCYEELDLDSEQTSLQWPEVLLYPVFVILLPVVVILIQILSILAIGWVLLASLYAAIKARIEDGKSYLWLLAGIGIPLVVILALLFLSGCIDTPTPSSNPPFLPFHMPTVSPTPLPVSTDTFIPSPNSPVPPAGLAYSFSILVDDFDPQSHSGASTYFYNRLGGDRGAINESHLEWGAGLVITTLSSGNSWGGVWMSLNHPIREVVPINTSAPLPQQILPAYQSQITGITVDVHDGTPGRTLKLELKDRRAARWVGRFDLRGGPQTVSADLPPLGEINEFVWVLDHASAGDSVVLERVSFTATTLITDTAMQAFVWSYGMLLNNWNSATGLVRDKATDASGEFDAVQATGSLAAATALAEQLGVVSHNDAVHIVGTISDTLLFNLPRFHGVWPHWVRVSPAGMLEIVPGTEWSSVDTIIAAVGLLAAQGGLGLDTSGTEQMLQAVDWTGLALPGGLSHGYTYAGDLIPYAWDVFGGETWLVELVCAGATGQVQPIAYASPPTANGSGFIDELAWLLVPPPSKLDVWGTDWTAYRLASADMQISYYPTHYPQSCFDQLGLFGLSAGEVPAPSALTDGGIYQAFGIGGRFTEVNDGSMLLGGPVVVPHYAAMIASLRPNEAIGMWTWLIENGLFTPLTNVESLMFPASSRCDVTGLQWNHLKGSWNLALQTLGLGRYLAERDGQIPVLWQATSASPLLQKGYSLLVPDEQRNVDSEVHRIPGKIEAEDYDTGGPDIAYYDTTVGNEGGEYRTDDVDIEITTDVDGGYNVGWAEEGEWLAYTVEVASTGLYDIQARVASALDRMVGATVPAAGTVDWTIPLTPTFHIEFDGADVSGPMIFVATGGWQNWTSVFARQMLLAEGQHTMRLVMDSGGVNLNWVLFTPSRPPEESSEEKIDWLIAQMTTEEKIVQLHGIDWMDTTDNTRLGIPGFRTADGPQPCRETRCRVHTRHPVDKGHCHGKTLCCDEPPAGQETCGLYDWETAYGLAYQVQVSDDALHWTGIYSTEAGNRLTSGGWR